MKKICGIALALIISSSVFGTDTVTLQQMKRTVINENVDIALAYENYVEAKETSRVRTLDILPGLNIDYFLYDYRYTLLRSVIPEPYRFLDVKAEKDMAQAAKMNQRVVQKNILQDLEVTFYLVNLDRELLKTYEQEKKLRDDILKRAMDSYNLGSMSFRSLNGYRRDSIKAKSTLLENRELVNNDILSLKLILGIDDFEAPLEVEAPLFDNDQFEYPTEVNDAADLAVNRSFEVKQYDYLAQAARHRKTGQSISWLSWSGIGFDYPARIRVAKSNIRKVELEKKKTTLKIKNQVASLYQQLALNHNSRENLLILQDIAQREMQSAQENYDNLLGTFVTLAESQISLLSIKRELLSNKYKREILLIKLKRALGINMLATPDNQIEMTQTNL